MKKKILVVDDDVSMRMLLSSALTINGHDVKTVEHGQQALLLIDNSNGNEKFIPDIVITNVGMTVLDGVGLARQLRM
ncbi:MAG: response regulator, partial [Candidatus Pacebacteria bacterium]|nr:response regulator [Candidatus Paceibacterota bacterium]